MNEHPLIALERAAREYDNAARASARADNDAAGLVTSGARRMHATERRAIKLTKAKNLQAAAVAFTEWKRRLDGDS